MKPISIEIKNYRSIKIISVPIENLSDSTRTYGLIGVNEAGKSSILKALALMGSGSTPNPKDFRIADAPVSISIVYQIPKDIVDRQEMMPDAMEELDTELFEKLMACSHIEAVHIFEATTLTKTITYVARATDDTIVEIPVSVIPPALLFRPIFGLPKRSI